MVQIGMFVNILDTSFIVGLKYVLKISFKICKEKKLIFNTEKRI